MMTSLRFNDAIAVDPVIEHETYFDLSMLADVFTAKDTKFGDLMPRTFCSTR
jgi:hypothetical protein